MGTFDNRANHETGAEFNYASVAIGPGLRNCTARPTGCFPRPLQYRSYSQYAGKGPLLGKGEPAVKRLLLMGKELPQQTRWTVCSSGG